MTGSTCGADRVFTGIHWSVRRMSKTWRTLTVPIMQAAQGLSHEDLVKSHERPVSTVPPGVQPTSCNTAAVLLSYLYNQQADTSCKYETCQTSLLYRNLYLHRGNATSLLDMHTLREEGAICFVKGYLTHQSGIADCPPLCTTVSVMRGGSQIPLARYGQGNVVGVCTKDPKA